MNTTLSLRLTDDLAKRLDDEVKRRRMTDGSAATKADIVREALEKHLKKK